MEVRSLPSGPRQNVGYMRFNLNVLTDTPATGAVFTISRDAGGSFTQGVMHVYGLRNDFGNTPQGWVETGLRYTNSGLELPGDGDATTQDLDLSRLDFIGDLPESTAVGDVLPVSTPALDAFLADRYADGGLATFLLVADDASEVEGRFETIEGAGGNPAPTLAVMGTLQALPPDTTPPTVAGASPVPGATSVEITTQVRVTFSEEMDVSTITNGTVFTLEDSGNNPVTATVDYDGAALTLTLTPDSLLEPASTYTATLSAGVSDVSSNALVSDYSWSFTTVDDTFPPVVVSVNPTNDAVDVEASAAVQVTFDEDMTPASITDSTFYLEDASGNPVAATASYDAGTFTASLYPDSLLKLKQIYTARVKGGAGGVTDLFGNALAADYAWSFTTTKLISPIQLIPDADAYLTNDEKDGPTNTHGGKDLVEVRWHEVRVHMGYVRYDITGISPSLFGSATLSGTFSGSGFNGPGTWNVYGLDDGVAGNDWDETSINYATAAGVDPAAAINAFGITNAPLLGTITLDGEDVQPLPFSSNTEDLDLTAFLEADTDGLVTFILISETQDGLEYRINSVNDTTPDEGHGPMTLNFLPLSSVIDAQVEAGPSFVVTWGIYLNHTYSVERTSEDLSAPDWVVLASNLVSDTVNAYTDNVPPAVQATYRIVDEGEIPPAEYFFEDFEGTTLGTTSNDWVMTSLAGTTTWAIGTPVDYGSADGVPPSGAYSGTSAAGTDLNADYAENTMTSLLSPVIDLTSTTNASLSFFTYVDTEGIDADFGDVFIRDEAGAEIAGLEAGTRYQGDQSSWVQQVIPLGPEALGRVIRIEYYFESDSSFNYSGWYIDDVRVGE